jgi:hypothetical protein
MMVWELLAPVNGKFLPIDVVPGGSVRLTIDQPGKAAAAAATKTASQQKKVGALQALVWSVGCGLARANAQQATLQKLAAHQAQHA